MKRILSLYIIREIASLFLLGIMVFTLILLMGRLIKLTDLVISRGVPLADVSRMILYLMPSFLVFTIPMAFLLAVLLAFGRLSADNEITVMKAGGISLMQLMPPVVLCGLCAALLTLAASTVGVPWGNNAFKDLSFAVLKQNVAATVLCHRWRYRWRA
jgi:lipopolysaccharide export system permease protein